MKIKSIKKIDQSNCFHGFTPNEVALLNQGETITIDKLRRDGKNFVEEIKPSPAKTPKKEKE